MVASTLLDASQFRAGTPSERSKYSKSLLEQLSGNGFARIRNHGIDSQRVEETFEWGRKFFELPLEEKRKVLNPPGPRPQRGWSTLGAEKTSTLYGKLMGHSVAEDLKDAREHFDFGTPEDTMFESRWPDEASLPGFRAHLEEFFRICEKLSLEIMQALEEAMGIPEGTFRQQCLPNASEFRLNHYPAMSAKALEDEKIERIWPHYDLGVITLLFTDCVGGLEFEDRERPKEFMQVEQVDKTDLIVNISETMEHWTARALPAGLHRVTSPKDVKLDAEGNGTIPERYSIAYFCKAARKAHVMPLQPFRGDHPVDAKESMTALEFQQKRLLTAY